MKHIFFLVLPAFVFSCGQTTEKPQKQTLECYVRYLVPEGEIHAEATLRTSEPQPRAVEASEGMRYQGKAMKVAAQPSVTYRWDDRGVFTPRHVFSWKDGKGNPQQFEMTLSPITVFGFGTKTLSRQEPATLRWEGDPLAKGETLVFLWENASLNKTIPMEVINTSGKPAIDFPASKVAELDPGLWTYYLVRKKLTKTDAGGVAASGIIEYYSKVDTVVVK